MKKNKILSIVSVALLLMTGCGGTSKDEVPPTIEGVKLEASIMVNEQYNIMDGVTAIDDVDGNLTSKIEYEIYPKYDDNIILNNVFIPVNVGEYEIAYSVKDSAGNEADTQYTTLTVTPGYGEKILTEEIDLSNVEMNDWETFIDSDVVGDVSVKNGKLVYNILTSTNTPSDITLSKVLTLNDESDYELQLSFTSNVSGDIYINEDKQTVVEEFNTINYKINSDSTENNDFNISVQLGELAPTFEFSISRIVLKEISGEDKLVNLLEEFDLSGSNVAYSEVSGGSEANVEATKENATMHITKAGDANGVWQSRLFIDTSLTLQPGKYQLGLDIVATNPYNDGFELIFYCGNIEKGLGQDLYGLKLNANEPKTLKMDITTTAVKNDIRFCLQLGHLDAGFTSNTITVSNVFINHMESSKNIVEEITNFVAKDIDCFNDSESGAAGTIYYDGESFVYDIESFGSNDWHNKLVFKNISLEVYKLYTIVFVAKADVSTKANIFINEKDSSWAPVLSDEIVFDTEYKTITVTMDTHLNSTGVFDLLLQFGGLNEVESSKIQIKSLKIYEQDYIF